MKQRIILTKGLPASGKTTYAKELIKKEPNKWKRINKDDLRAMFDDGKWSKENEKFIINTRDVLLHQALIDGYNVIIDDTNLSPKHWNHIAEIIKNLPPEIDVEMELKDFTDVSVDECIKRDQKRMNYVGEKVIRQMYNQFLRRISNTPPALPGLPTAILCDLDGTLALFGDKNPYERNFINDKINESVEKILRVFSEQDYEIIFVSGRKAKFLEETQRWLDKNKIPYNAILMPRQEGDNRKDVIIKSELYENYIKGKYNVAFVIDDRPQVCRLWYELGLPLFKVGNPDADF